MIKKYVWGVVHVRTDNLWLCEKKPTLKQLKAMSHNLDKSYCHPEEIDDEWIEDSYEIKKIYICNDFDKAITKKYRNY